MRGAAFDLGDDDAEFRREGAAARGGDVREDAIGRATGSDSYGEQIESIRERRHRPRPPPPAGALKEGVGPDESRGGHADEHEGRQPAGNRWSEDHRNQHAHGRGRHLAREHHSHRKAFGEAGAHEPVGNAKPKRRLREPPRAFAEDACDRAVAETVLRALAARRASSRDQSLTYGEQRQHGGKRG